MSDRDHLERRYRRLLGWYPPAFRREHEEEMLSVLMSGAPEGAGRPQPAEAADLVRGGLSMRARHKLRNSQDWEYAHRRVMVPVRVAIGVWLVILTAILYRSGVGGWWGLLLVPAAALHFYLAYRNVRRSLQR